MLEFKGVCAREASSGEIGNCNQLNTPSKATATATLGEDEDLVSLCIIHRKEEMSGEKAKC